MNNRETGQEPLLDQIAKKEMELAWIAVRRNVSITKHVTPQGHRGRGEPWNTWRRDLEKEMWTAGYKYTAGGRWRRQHKTELDGDKWSVDYVPLGATRHKSSK